MTVLFRHTFPKQPDTRHFSIILWMPKPDKYAVHMEINRDGEPAFRATGDYFSADQFKGNLGKAFTKAFVCYNKRCQTELNRYNSSAFWERVLEEHYGSA